MPMRKTSETQSLRETIIHQTFHNGPTIFIRSSFAALLFFPFLPDLGDLLFWLFEPLTPFPYVVVRSLDGLYVGPWDGFFVGFAVNFEVVFDKVGGDVKDLVGLSVELTGVLGASNVGREGGDKTTVGLSVFFNVGGCVLSRRLGTDEEAMVGVCDPIELGSGEETMVGVCDPAELGSGEGAMVGVCDPSRLGAGEESPEGLADDISVGVLDAMMEGLFVGDAVGKAVGFVDANVQVSSRAGIDSLLYTIHPIESPTS
mmetsp:Transcript_6630/g.9715  ORF Transcript_6630/g.9715 Transcript_6630/m.9715 type:complete len:258 (+) Transcript_6630:142-915(+)